MHSFANGARSFHDELRSFSVFNRKTEVSEREVAGQKVTVYENEFRTSKQRDGNSLHEISYRACYKPQLPAFFIERVCKEGDVVYDPFMGRGTTLIEAQLHGCKAIGNDINPLSIVLTAPRLNPPTVQMVEQRLREVSLTRKKDAEETSEDLLVFFDTKTLDELYAWRAYFRERKNSGAFDNVDAWIQMVACNRLTGHSKGFFSVYTLPPNQAASVKAQRRINEKRNQVPEYRDTKALILRKTRQLIRHGLPDDYSRKDFMLLCDSAEYTPGIPTSSVKLVVTSPPFLDTVDYVGDNWLRMWFCEISVEEQKIWQIKQLESWVDRMTGVFKELKRILHPDGIVAFEVGEIRKGELLLENEVIKAAAAAGLASESIILNTQNFTKTANCWGVANNELGTNSNRIVILRN